MMTEEKRTIRVRVTQELQTGLELELDTLFGLRVDDRQETGLLGEVLLVYVVQAGDVGGVVALLETKKAAGAIVDVAASAPPSPWEQVRRVYDALAHVEEEWLARELGDEHLGALQDAVQEYIERRVVRPRLAPLSPVVLRTSVIRGEYVSGVVAVDLSDIIDHDLEGFLDELSRQLTGSELLENVNYDVVGREGDTLWLKVTGDASRVVGCLDEDELANQILAYCEELVVYTEEEARMIREASAIDPWMDQGVSEAMGYGYVLAARDTEQPGEDIVIPAGVSGVRKAGLWIDGALEDVLHHCALLLGAQRTWRAWPNSDLALVVPDPSCARPLDDPLLQQLAQAMVLVVVLTLQDVKLTFVDLCEGYLLARNGQGTYEVWEILPNGRGTDDALALAFEGDLYCYGNTFLTRELAESAIERRRDN